MYIIWFFSTTTKNLRINLKFFWNYRKKMFGQVRVVILSEESMRSLQQKSFHKKNQEIEIILGFKNILLKICKTFFIFNMEGKISFILNGVCL